MTNDEVIASVPSVEEYQELFHTLTHLYCHYRLSRFDKKDALAKRIALEEQRLIALGIDRIAFELYRAYLNNTRDFSLFEAFATYVNST